MARGLESDENICGWMGRFRYDFIMFMRQLFCAFWILIWYINLSQLTKGHAKADQIAKVFKGLGGIFALNMVFNHILQKVTKGQCDVPITYTVLDEEKGEEVTVESTGFVVSYWVYVIMVLQFA